MSSATEVQACDLQLYGESDRAQAQAVARSPRVKRRFGALE